MPVFGLRTTSGRSGLVLGSYEPDDSTTGVPSSVLPLLTPLTGNQTITAAGTTLYRRDITGRVDVRAANVTLRECLIRGTTSVTTSHGCVTATNAAVVNLLVEDCTIDPGAANATYWQTGIMGHDFTSRRNRIKNVVDPIGIFNTFAAGSNSNVIVEGDYLGPCSWFAVDPSQVDGSHNDVIQIQGGVGTIIRYNRLWGYQSLEVGDGEDGGRQGPTQTQSLSCIQFNDNVGDPYGVQAYENWMYGGEISVNGSDSSMTAPAGEVIADFARNRFSRDQWFYPTDVQLYLDGPSTKWAAHAGTADKNIFMSDGAEITVNYV